MKNNKLLSIGLFCAAIVYCMAPAGSLMAAGLPGAPNGTVVRNGLVWLKNANCFGQQTWEQAMISAASLKSGSCGLTDGSTGGQWRLPTKSELVAIFAYLSDFSNVQTHYYWTNENFAHFTTQATVVSMQTGNDNHGLTKTSYVYSWPVRPLY